MCGVFKWIQKRNTKFFVTGRFIHFGAQCLEGHQEFLPVVPEEHSSAQRPNTVGTFVVGNYLAH